MKLEFANKSCNENLARLAAAAFVTPLDPTCEELSEIKTAISEAVTNAIIHGYEDSIGMVRLDGRIYGNIVEFTISDKGCGIQDVSKAMEPLYTTGGEERAGLGFAVMESMMDKIKVTSKPDKGTTITLIKRISDKENAK